MICDFNQKIEPTIFFQLAAKAHAGAAQVRGVPSVRFNFVFEKPLHAGGVFRRSALSQGATHLRRNIRRCACDPRQGWRPADCVFTTCVLLEHRSLCRKSKVIKLSPIPLRSPTTKPFWAGPLLRHNDASASR